MLPASSAFVTSADIQAPVISRTTRHPIRRRTSGILMLTPVPLRRIQPGKDRAAFGAIHGRPKRAGIARRRGMPVLILQAREGLATVFAWMSFSPRVFPGFRAPATSTVACASLRPPGCGRGYRWRRRWEGRRGCGRERGGGGGGGRGCRCYSEKLAPFVVFRLNVLDIGEGGGQTGWGRTGRND